MEIKPTNEVHLIKSVPFSIDYKNVILFDNAAKQTEYFNSLENLVFDNVTYVRSNGKIKVKAERDSILEYNYMSFTNKNYSNKTFYAFITNIEYINPNTSLVSFVIDEWQTWCFDLQFRDCFIERKHCKRWNTDGTPVINTQDEGLDFGSEYIVKDHREYNNDLYWLCLVTSIEEHGINLLNREDVPTILSLFYIPIYKTTNVSTSSWFLNGNKMADVRTALVNFRNGTKINKTLRSAFILSEPPFKYTYSVSGDVINITSTEMQAWDITINTTGTDKMKMAIWLSTKNPNSVLRTFPKYGNLKNNITESKLLMYPYSFVQLVDGQGNSFDIKNEYLDDTQINVRTFTSGGLNSKQAHIVEHYRYKGITLNYCRWELGNGIINNFPNNLTIVDDYSAAYLQGNANQINQSIANTISQTQLNNTMVKNVANASNEGNTWKAIGTLVSGAVLGGEKNGLSGAVAGALSGAAEGFTSKYANELLNEANVKNTGLQGNLTNEKAINSAIAKKQDAKNVADNVSLQGGDVYFTYQNQYSGYCLVYKQISDEYIKVLEDFFKKFGYAYNKIETPNLHTRKSWDYIRTVDCNIKANINDDSVEKIKSIFNQGVTIWHTTDVCNYKLNNDEI